jgi:hypothetical protein
MSVIDRLKKDVEHLDAVQHDEEASKAAVLALASTLDKYMKHLNVKRPSERHTNTKAELAYNRMLVLSAETPTGRPPKDGRRPAKGHADKRAGKEFGVGPTYVKYFGQVLKSGYTDILQDVRDLKLTLPKAVMEIKARNESVER